MTRTHFNTIAEGIQLGIDRCTYLDHPLTPEQKFLIAQGIAAMLIDTNTRFDVKRFIEAATKLEVK
jgi:hypothetical protein